MKHQNDEMILYSKNQEAYDMYYDYDYHAYQTRTYISNTYVGA